MSVNEFDSESVEIVNKLKKSRTDPDMARYLDGESAKRTLVIAMIMTVFLMIAPSFLTYLLNDMVEMAGDTSSNKISIHNLQFICYPVALITFIVGLFSLINVIGGISAKRRLEERRNSKNKI